MAQGPEQSIAVFNRAELNGVQFGCEEIEKASKAKNSIVMLRRQQGDNTCGGIYVGRVQSFITHTNPATRLEANILDAKWFKEPTPVSAGWNAELQCPVVMKAYSPPAPTGGYWKLEEVPPTKLILAPHIQDKNKWQVLHVHSDFLTRP
jgi:hypothetical protein